MTQRTTVAIGQSLYPLIRSGELLTFELFEGSLPKAGELIVYGNNLLVCHRVLHREKRKDGWWFFIKADSNLIADGWFAQAALVGRVVAHNGKSIHRTGFRVLSKLFYWKSVIEWKVFAALFKSPFGQVLSPLWHRVFINPFLSRWFHVFFCPWTLRKQDARYL